MRGFLTRHAFLLRFALLSSFMGTSVGLAKFATTLYALELGAKGWLLAAMAGAQSVGLLFMSLPVGFWVERFGPARLFVAGSWVMGLLYALIPAVPHALFLLAVTASISFLMPLRFVSLNTVFMAALERIGHAQAGWQRGAHMSGMYLLGPVLAASVIHWGGHAGCYWLIAGMFFTTALLAGPVLHDPVHASTPSGKRVGIAHSVRALWAEPAVRTLARLEFSVQAAHAYYSFYIVVIAVQQLGVPALGAGTLVAAQGGAFIFSLIFLGRWTAWLGPMRTLVGSALGVALAMALLAMAHSIGGLWVGGALLGLGLGLLQIHTLTQFAHWGTKLGRGRVSGLSALAGPTGGFLGGMLGGTAGATLGLQTVFVVFVPVFTLLAYSGYQTHQKQLALSA
jgi:MFS family permease